jgi:hypothetical protein
VATLRSDWSHRVLRTSPKLALDFGDSVHPHGTIATARATKGAALSERRVTTHEVVLLTALQSPRSMPPNLIAQIPDCSLALSQLVLDGLIEVHGNDQFLSGVAALKFLGRDGGDGRVEEASAVSALALQYALAVRHLKPSVLAQRLYAFNSLPAVRSEAQDYAADFAAATGVDVNDPSPPIGGFAWTVQRESGWLYFRRGAARAGRFKVYLCPKPRDIHKVISAFAEVLGRNGGVFKMAFPRASLVRPDKIVAYFPAFRGLQQALAAVADRLPRDASVQAVPFSAPVGGAPLLSWGVDPPNLSARKSTSWRSWLTTQVAECVHGIPPGKSPVEALEHLKAALKLRDIDPVGWLPVQEFLSRKWRIEL